MSASFGWLQVSYRRPKSVQAARCDLSSCTAHMYAWRASIGWFCCWYNTLKIEWEANQAGSKLCRLWTAFDKHSPNIFPIFFTSKFYFHRKQMSPTGARTGRKKMSGKHKPKQLLNMYQSYIPASWENISSTVQEILCRQESLMLMLLLCQPNLDQKQNVPLHIWWGNINLNFFILPLFADSYFFFRML